MQSLNTIGINHKTAPIDLREKVAFDTSNLKHALDDFKHYYPKDEVAILSTCNRTEIYSTTPSAFDTASWFSQYHNIENNLLKSHLYEFSNEDVIDHAIRVASGMDSMVLGETQIFGQLKNAVSISAKSKATGKILNKLFQSAFSTAKIIRTKTNIGSNSITIPSAVMKISERIFPKINDQNILLIGYGEMNEIVSKYFINLNPRKLSVCSRNKPTKIKDLILNNSINWFSIQELLEKLPLYDIVISSTASMVPIIGKGAVEKSILKRRHKPQLLVDLAVPRDIEKEVYDLDDVYLYTVDDLGDFIKKGLSLREESLEYAEDILEIGVEKFMNWFKSQKRINAISHLNNQIKILKENELALAISLINKGNPPEEVLAKLSNTLTKKFSHLAFELLKKIDDKELDRFTKFSFKRRK